MRMGKTRSWIAAAGALLACGCGFKGPLYLPERNATVVTHPAQGEGAQSPGQRQTPGAKEKGKAPAAPPRSSTPP